MKRAFSDLFKLSKNRPNFNSKSAFTIIELLVVITIIGILAAITIVSYTGISNRATIAALQSDLANASQQLKMFYVDNAIYPGSVTDCPTPAAGNLCLKSSGGNTYSSYSANNSTNPPTFSLSATNSSYIYKVTDNTQPVALVSAPLTPVADWLATMQGDHYGNFYDLVSKQYASVTRTGVKTVYDPFTNHIYDVPANYLGIRPRSDGNSGSEAVKEAGTTNQFQYSTFSNQAALNHWTVDSGLTATLGGTSSLYTPANEVTLSAGGSNVAFWEYIWGPATNDFLSVYVRKSDGSPVTSADMQMAAAAGSSTPVGSPLATTFTQLGTSSIYRAYATFVGANVNLANGLVVKANKSIIVTCLQAEYDSGTGVPSSYIPTSGSVASRGNETVQVPTSNWSPSNISIAAVAGLPAVSGTSIYLSWNNNDTDRIWTYTNGGSFMGYSKTGGTNSGNNRTYGGLTYFTGVDVFPNGQLIHAYVNGATGSSSMNHATPSGLPSTASIGSDQYESGIYSGSIQRIVIYSSALAPSDVTTVTNAIQNGP